jgi:hypothetical protein
MPISFWPARGFIPHDSRTATAKRGPKCDYMLTIFCARHRLTMGTLRVEGGSCSGYRYHRNAHVMGESDTRVRLETIHTQLRAALRNGARAAHLVTYTPEVINTLIRTPADGSDSPIYDRALEAESIIRKGIVAIGGDAAEALTIVYALKPGTLGRSLQQRREWAARLLEMTGGNFRRHRNEGLLIWDLAAEVYKIVQGE